MQKGAAVVNDEKLTNQEIKVELNKLELKYKLKELDAKLMTEKEDLQTWVLSVKLDEYKGTKKIERKPTKAETEEEVSEADRKLHQKIASKVKAELEAKVSKDANGRMPTPEELIQMEDYAYILRKKGAWKPSLNATPIVFDHVKYTFNDVETMNKWFVTPTNGREPQGKSIFKQSQVSWDTP